MKFLNKLKNKLPARLSPFFAITIILFLTGCVGQKKYKTALESKSFLEEKIKKDSVNYARLEAQKDILLDEQSKALKEQTQILNVKIDKLDSLEELLTNQKSHLSDVKTLLDDVKTIDWEIEQLNGFLLIELDDEILFKTGSTEISDKGLELISDMSNAIKNALDDQVKVWVAGHTDDQPFISKKFNNWDLSAQRAIAVINELEKNGTKPWKMTALAKSKYNPQVPNLSEKDRSKNRRTEIFLIPDNTEVSQLITSLMTE